MLKYVVIAAVLLCAPEIAVAANPALTKTAAAMKVRPQAEKAQSAREVVQGFYDQLLQVMQRGENLGFEGRYAQLQPAVERAFDLPAMTRFAAGSGWFAAPADQQQNLVGSFSDFSVATYANRFRKYDGEKFEVIGEKEAPGGAVIVETRLTPGGGDAPIALNYLLRKNAQQAWRINDVYLDATISELATRRAEFSAVIRDQGVPALIDAIGQKAKGLRSS